MSTAQLRRSLHILTALILCFSVAASCTIWLWPMPQGQTFATQRRPHSTADPFALPSLADFQKIADGNLRRPLIDSPIQLPVMPVRVPTTLPVRLVGTAIEPGRSIAIFMTDSGTMEMHGVGEKAAGAEVIDITERSAKLKHENQIIMLSLAAAPSIASAAEGWTPIYVRAGKPKVEDEDPSERAALLLLDEEARRPADQQENIDEEAAESPEKDPE